MAQKQILFSKIFIYFLLASFSVACSPKLFQQNDLDRNGTQTPVFNSMDPQFTGSGVGILGGRLLPSEHPISRSTVFIIIHTEGNSPRFCSSVLLSAHFLLTAAHCLWPLENSKEYHRPLLIQAIFTNQVQRLKGRFPKNLVRNITKIFFHPGYSPKVCRDNIKNCSDLALIQLQSRPPLPYQAALRPGFHQYWDLMEANTYLGLAGFGVDEYQSQGQLKLIYKSIANRSKNSIFIVNQKDKKGACYGDSGGSAWFFDNQQRTYLLVGMHIGVQPGCYGEGIVANLSYYSPWIESTLNTITAMP